MGPTSAHQWYGMVCLSAPLQIRGSFVVVVMVGNILYTLVCSVENFREL